MVTKLDKFGRIIIPKTIRNDLGLNPGTVVNVTSTEAGVFIQVSLKPPFIKTKEGALIYTGKIIGDTSDIIEKDREERIKFLSDLQ